MDVLPLGGRRVPCFGGSRQELGLIRTTAKACELAVAETFGQAENVVAASYRNQRQDSGRSTALIAVVRFHVNGLSFAPRHDTVLVASVIAAIGVFCLPSRFGWRMLAVGVGLALAGAWPLTLGIYRSPKPPNSRTRP